LRNASQHSARFPNEAELAECFVYSRDILRELVSAVWDADFENLSLSQLVRYDYARRLLQEAEFALQSGNWTDAISKAAYALQDSIRIAFEYSGHLQHAIEQLGQGQGAADPDTRQTLSNIIAVIDDFLLPSALGLDLKALRRIRSLTGSWSTSSGTDIRYHHISPHLTESDALFVVDAALVAVLKIEEYVGDLEQPFGVNIWISDAIAEIYERYQIPEDHLPEIPEASGMWWEKASADNRPDLRLHRAVTALTTASAALKESRPRHAELLHVIQQFIIYLNYYASEFGDSDEIETRRLLAIINLVGHDVKPL